MPIVSSLSYKRWKPRIGEEWSSLSLSLSLYVYMYIQRFDALSRARSSVIREKRNGGEKNGILLQALFPKQWERSTEVCHNIEQHISRVLSAFRTRSIPSGMRVFFWRQSRQKIEETVIYTVFLGAVRVPRCEKSVSEYLLNCCWQQVFHQVWNNVRWRNDAYTFFFFFFSSLKVE